MSEKHRRPEVPEERVPVVECHDGLARITSKELEGVCVFAHKERGVCVCVFVQRKRGVCLSKERVVCVFAQRERCVFEQREKEVCMCETRRDDALSFGQPDKRLSMDPQQNTKRKASLRQLTSCGTREVPSH